MKVRLLQALFVNMKTGFNLHLTVKGSREETEGLICLEGKASNKFEHFGKWVQRPCRLHEDVLRSAAASQVVRYCIFVNSKIL